MEESAVSFAAYDVWYGEDMREHPHIEAVFRLMFVVNIESAKKQQSNEENIHSSTCVHLVSLDYEISVPHDRAQKPLDMRTRITLVLPPFHFQNGGRQIKIQYVIVDAVAPLPFLWEIWIKDDLNLTSFEDASEPSGKRSDQNQFA